MADNETQVATEETQAAGTQGQADKPAEKKLSPKNKLSRGIDPSLITTWVPSDNTTELNDVLNNAAKFRETKVGDMLAGILKDAIAAQLDTLRDDASKYVPVVGSGTGRSKVKLEDMTPEELEKYEKTQRKTAESAMERAQKASQAAQALLAAARARQAK